MANGGNGVAIAYSRLCSSKVVIVCCLLSCTIIRVVTSVGDVRPIVDAHGIVVECFNVAMAEVNDSLFDTLVNGESIALTLGSWGKDEHFQVKEEPP